MSCGATDWRELPAIPEAERPETPEKVSQTLLGRAAVCPRSALLYHVHKGPTSLAMDGGSAWHYFAERAAELLIEQNEPSLPPEMAKVLIQEAIDNPEFTVGPKQADNLRIAAYHFAEGFSVDPESIVGVEQMLELDVPPFVVRGKVDLAYAVGDDTLANRDYKFTFNYPSQEEFDGSFQSWLYAVMLAFGFPVTKVDDEWVRGPSLGDRAQMFDLAELYPLLDVRDGELAKRQTFVTRPELEDHRAYIEGLVAKVAGAFESGEWPAVPGSHCSTCPAPHECPLPAVLRDHAGAIETEEQAVEALAWMGFQAARVAAVKKEARNFASANGPVRVGDLIWEFADEESEEWITGKRIGRPDSAAARDAMLEAVDRAVRFGEVFDYWEFRRRRRQTPFRKRELSEDEKRLTPEPVTVGEGFGDDPPF